MPLYSPRTMGCRIESLDRPVPMKHGDFFSFQDNPLNPNIVTYRFYMMKDVRAMILPDCIIIPTVPRDDEAMDSIQYWDEPVNPSMINQ